MKYILSAYCNDCSWVKKYTDDFLIFDRSETPKYTKDMANVRRVPNVGNVDYDKLSYIVENYDSLPDVFILAKGNLFKSISEEEFEKVKDSKGFTPLLTKNHRTYSDKNGPVCFYDENGMYNERNDSWYLQAHPSIYFSSYNQFAQRFMLPSPAYLKFAPGGNYIVTRERVHRYGKDFYEELRSILPYTQLPGEAQMIERTYYQLWS